MGESDGPACGPPASFPVLLASSACTLEGMSTNPGLQCGAYVGAVVEMICVVCGGGGGLQRGNSGDGCVDFV